MDELLYMDAEIAPHRSLSRRGFITLISVLTGCNTLTAVIFLAVGAAPIPIFLGMDLLAVVVAFLASNQAARQRERIQVTVAEVRVLLQTARGELHTLWVSPTAFTRVALSGDAEHDGDLHLRLSDRAIPVARALSRPERVEFAQALDAAILQARTGRLSH